MNNNKQTAKSNLHQKWTYLAKRLNSIARQNDGITVISITVAADTNGEPIEWHINRAVALEPRLEMNRTLLEKKLGKEDLQLLLQYIVQNV